MGEGIFCLGAGGQKGKIYIPLPFIKAESVDDDDNNDDDDDDDDDDGCGVDGGKASAGDASRNSCRHRSRTACVQPEASSCSRK